MQPKHYFAHVLLQHHPAPRDTTALAAVVKEHFAKTLSADALTESLRTRLTKRRSQEAVHSELARLEQELVALGAAKDARIDLLRQKVGELQKKIRMT